MAKYKTTVTEKDGTKSSGYIENGKSYYDNDKEINAGASVTDSSGKTWTKGGTTASTPSYNQTWESGGRTYVGGVDVGPAGTKVDTSNTGGMISTATKQNSSSSSYRPNYGTIGDNIQTNPFEDEIDRITEAYERQQEQIREQNRLAIEQGTSRLEAQKDSINQAAEDNARQAYIMQMQAKRALPQQLAGQGATGGTTETANLGIQTTYQNNLNDINRNRANAIQEIDNAIVDLKNTGNLATVEQVLANNQATLDAYMSMLDKGVAYNQWANQYNAGRVSDAYTESLNRAKLMADMGDFSGLKNLGYDTSELERQWKLNMANTQSLINQRYNDEGESQTTVNETLTPSKNYSSILNNTRDYASSGYYEDNMAGAKYVMGEFELGNLNLGEVKNIIKQANIPIETVARTLKKSFGATDEEISDFVINYYNENISDDYLAKIINFANSKEYVEPTEK